MKTLATCAAMMMAVVAVSTSVVLGFPGGVVYTDVNAKQVMYRPLSWPATQPSSLTADLKMNIVGPSAISQDGRWLVWFDLARHAFWVREMPGYKAYKAPCKSGPSGLPPEVVGVPKDLCLSSGGEMFAYSINCTLGELGFGQMNARVLRTKTDFVISRPTDSHSINPNPTATYGMHTYGGYQDTGFEPNYLPAWSNDGRLAVFGKRGENWTIDVWPEIAVFRKNVDAETEKSMVSGKPRQITATQKTLRGVAWKPDEAVTWWLADGQLCSENGTVLAKGIFATRIIWISKDSFLFRSAKDSGLYLWTSGESRKMLDAVPEEFSYCSESPLTERPLNSNFDPKWAKYDVESSGKRTKAENDEVIGLIQVSFGNNEINVGKYPGQDQLEYVFPRETEISDIKDPSKYEFTKAPLPGPPGVPADKVSPTNGLSGSRGISSQKPVYIKWPNGVVILLRLNDRYAAIKKLKTESTYKNWDEVPASLDPNSITGCGHREDFLKNGLPPPWQTMTFEWKYWPAPKPAAVTDKVSAVPPPKN